MKKIIRGLGIAGIVLGTSLSFKGCVDDFNYETAMIRQGKEECFEKKGEFKDRQNAYEFVGGLGLITAGLCGIGYRKKSIIFYPNNS